MPLTIAPDQALLSRDRQGPAGLHHLQRRMGHWAHLRDERGPEVAVRHPRQAADMRTDGTRATFDGAKAQFESIWRRWLAWAKLREDT